MSWNEAWDVEVRAGRECPVCRVPHQGGSRLITQTDFTAYSWKCVRYGADGMAKSLARSHTGGEYIKVYKNRIRPMTNQDIYDLYTQRAHYRQSCGTWSDEVEEKKEKIGDTNEFGEICP